jgi:histidyl-tRNA synthetase
MTKDTIRRPSASLPRGFRDISGPEVAAEARMLASIREVFELYGYDALTTPAIEYTEALGKFLPDTDRPNAGVFSFQDEDEQWMSLRYDMTAPLARHVAELGDKLAKPYRRYAMGPVWRNEKPGPGRFRQFTQCDADTVGTDNIAADAEACMLMADVMEKLGIARGQYVIKVNNRKVLDGVMEAVGLSGAENADTRLNVMRTLDKYDRLGQTGVRALLGAGRTDASGDRTQGAGLSDKVIDLLVGLVNYRTQDEGKDRLDGGARRTGYNPEIATLAGVTRTSTAYISEVFGSHFELTSGQDRRNLVLLETGLKELVQIGDLVSAAGYGDGRIIFDPSCVRGLDYYTGPVFEAELTFPVKNDDGETVRFGSVGGGGRYDDLVARFTGQRVPATGFSIGVSRLLAALTTLNKATAVAPTGPVVVLVMDKAELPRYQAMAHTLRKAGIRAEMYLGTAGMKPQMKYADRRHAPCVIIQGSQEREQGVVQIKDLVEGAKQALLIKDSAEYKAARPAQHSVPEAELVAAVQAILKAQAA